MQKYKDILLNRTDAARKLVDILPMQKFRDEKWNIIAVSRAGLELGMIIRGKYSNHLDILFSEAIMAPNNPECEIARVSENEEIVLNEELINSFGVQYDYIYGEAHRKHEEDILSYIYRYRKGEPFPDMQNEVVLLVDDGSETGSKFMTALKTILVQKPKAIYIAVPVIPTDVLEILETFVDEIFFLYNIEDYVQTGLYYKDFNDVNDEELEKLLEENR